MVDDLLNLSWMLARVDIDGRACNGAVCEVYEKYPGGNYWTTCLWAFGTGDVLVRLQPGTLVRTMEALELEVADGRLVAFPPEMATIVLRSRVVFTVTKVDSRVDAASLLLDVRDIQSQLAGSPPRLEQCRDAVRGYVKTPSTASLARLKRIYEEVPKHMRPFLLGMDAKDYPVRALLSAATAEEERARYEALRECIEWEWPE